MRVLILADLCNPEWPSLPVVGYKYAKALAERVDAVVVTQARNRPHIEPEGLGRSKVDYLDTEYVAKPMYKLATLLRGGDRGGWTLQMAMDYPSYLSFERAAWHKYRKTLRAGEFDLVHRITSMSYALPSYFVKRCPVPFVLGPLNGNLSWPREFSAERRREWLSKFRHFYKVLPYHRSTYRHSAAVPAAFDHTSADLPQAVLPRTINLPEVGIDPELFSPSIAGYWKRKYPGPYFCQSEQPALVANG